MIADDFGRKGREESGGLPGMTRGAFRVFDPVMNGLGRFKLRGTGFAAIFIERHVFFRSISDELCITAGRR